MENQINETIDSAGFTFSGPHGIGKSGVGLLLASYAFLNNHFLVYIVSNSILLKFFNIYFSHYVQNWDFITTKLHRNSLVHL